MKYYSDYFEDRVYALDEKRNGTVKEIRIESMRPIVLFKTGTWAVKDVSLVKVENAIFRDLKEITKEEYEGYGVTWMWHPLGDGIRNRYREPIINL